ncbi:MAG: helix-turn-helix transcriptional regulator [Sphingobium sp.]|nr:helix-turn-helix transcriptional regulator [Sphingobium sp.]MBP9158521.1 helix-turn-helix transcriptional regulator [Sphingobium sp.]
MARSKYCAVVELLKERSLLPKQAIAWLAIPVLRSARAAVVILDETRKLITDKGIDALCMDQICRKSGVSKRTLYNAFGTREYMIAKVSQGLIARAPYRHRWARKSTTLSVWCPLSSAMVVSKLYHRPTYDPKSGASGA